MRADTRISREFGWGNFAALVPKDTLFELGKHQTDLHRALKIHRLRKRSQAF